jgi:hypothetical protein
MTIPEGNAKKAMRRPFYYGYGRDNTIRAYTRDEWGIGGALPSGNYQTRSLTFMVIITIVMIPAAVLSLLFLIMSVIKLNVLIAIFALICTVLFGTAVVVGFSTSRHEFKARGLRKARGLPKPLFSVTDDRALEWYKNNPSDAVPVTRENFPDAHWD